jgi:hypothetical protein
VRQVSSGYPEVELDGRRSESYAQKQQATASDVIYVGSLFCDMQQRPEPGLSEL